MIVEVLNLTQQDQRRNIVRISLEYPRQRLLRSIKLMREHLSTGHQEQGRSLLLAYRGCTLGQRNCRRKILLANRLFTLLQ